MNRIKDVHYMFRTNRMLLTAEDGQKIDISGNTAIAINPGLPKVGQDITPYLQVAKQACVYPLQQEARDVARTMQELRDELHGTLEPSKAPEIAVEPHPLAMTKAEHRHAIYTKNMRRLAILGQIETLVAEL